jgi:hypothetical protein
MNLPKTNRPLLTMVCVVASTLVCASLSAQESRSKPTGGDTKALDTVVVTTDEFYADYSDMSPDQLTIAPPRSVDLTYTAHFR